VSGSQHAFEVPLGRVFSVAPGLPTADMTRTVEYYRGLGFSFSAPGRAEVADAEFAIAGRDGVELHFALKRDHDPARTAMWVYFHVENADELAAEFAAAGTVPRRAVHDTDYRMREFAIIDPDGNLLLFGSSRPEAPSDPPVHGPTVPARHDPDQKASELATALKRGDASQVRDLLADDSSLATAVINGYRPLHLFADAPGHRPNAAAIVTALVEAGADLDAHAVDTWHHETALHWAASNDDVSLIDVLLDAGADIEHPGSSTGGGPPSQSALGHAQWSALRRLYERGAAMSLAQAAALGLMPLVTSVAEAVPSPGPEEISVAFWNACRAGQLAAARYLLARGADLNWPAPWSGETPLDAARARHENEMVAWLTAEGATSGA
jgi:uncharacterized protein